MPDSNFSSSIAECGFSRTEVDGMWTAGLSRDCIGARHRVLAGRYVCTPVDA